MRATQASRSGSNDLIMAFARISVSARSSGECEAKFNSQPHIFRSG
jgi:hypothetical protein